MSSTNGTTKGEPKVAINGETSGWQPDTREEILIAMGQNGGLKRIQATMRQRLDESGWSEDLKNYITALFRSGAAITYDDALKIVKERMESEVADPDGNDHGVPAPNLALPQSVKEDGKAIVVKEMRAITKTKK